MASHSALGAGPDRSARSIYGIPLGVCVGVLLATGVNTASASVLGNLATSVGLLAALAGLFVFKGWATHFPTAVLSTAGGVLLVAGSAVWMSWRSGALGRVAGAVNFANGSASHVVPTFARNVPASEIVLPEGFERDPLLADLRCHFLRLQHAWDGTEMTALGALTTREMLAELFLERQGSLDLGRANLTQVVTLRAELLGFECLAQVFLASVEFSGLLRESADRGAVPFREVWLLTQSKYEPGTWRLARHQTLI